MALKKPSDMFGTKKSSGVFELPEVSSHITESYDKFKNNFEKVNQLSEKVQVLSQELSEKLTKTDLESAMLSQLMVLDENFKSIQDQVKGLNKKDLREFKQTVSILTAIVENLIETEIPKYKKQITSNEVRLSNQLEDFKVEVGEKVQEFYKVLYEFNDVVQVIEAVSNIEKYIQVHNRELVELREEVFSEIESLPVGNLQENIQRLEKKIDHIRDTYSKIDPESVAREIIQEGLLNEPPEIKNSDLLTPLDQNFVTVDQLQDHYRLFINRIQQQLATLTGGGETRLKYLDDIVGIATDPESYDGKFLKYNHTLGKFEFASTAGSQTLDETLAFGNSSNIPMSVGLVTATYLNSTGGAQISGFEGLIVSGISTALTVDGNVKLNSHTATVGVATVGISTNFLIVNSSARLLSGAVISGLGTALQVVGTTRIAGETTISGVTTVGVATTATTPPQNSQISFELSDDNTSLRIRVRGNDGILRYADVGLST